MKDCSLFIIHHSSFIICLDDCGHQPPEQECDFSVAEVVVDERAGREARERAGRAEEESMRACIGCGAEAVFGVGDEPPEGVDEPEPEEQGGETAVEGELNGGGVCMEHV